LDKEAKDTMYSLWERLPMLTSIFHFCDFESLGDDGGCRGRGFWADADAMTTAIRDLARI
jgi:hypothetical protein